VQKVKLEKKKQKLLVLTHVQFLVLRGGASFVLRLREKIKLEFTVLEKQIVKQYCSFIKHEGLITRTARWTRSAPFNLFYYAHYYHDMKACVYHKITSLQIFRLHFSCIFISSKPAKFLFLLIHHQFSNIVIFGEEHKLWTFSMWNSVLSHNTCSLFGPHTVFSTSCSDIMKDHPNHTKISEEDNLFCENL
jgi:hypothetical protein